MLMILVSTIAALSYLYAPDRQSQARLRRAPE
jgi:hypothetical protein